MKSKSKGRKKTGDGPSTPYTRPGSVGGAQKKQKKATKFSEDDFFSNVTPRDYNPVTLRAPVLEVENICCKYCNRYFSSIEISSHLRHCDPQRDGIVMPVTPKKRKE